MLTLAGAEKPRKTEGVGRVGTSTNLNTWEASRTCTSPSATSSPPSSRNGRSSPLWPSSPSRTGMCSGFLSGSPVVAGEVEVHALPEAIAPDDGLDHAHELGALLIDGGRVEIVDLHVAARPHGGRERACVLGELALLQLAHA